jgi:hypothetical protein
VILTISKTDPAHLAMRRTRTVRKNKMDPREKPARVVPEMLIASASARSAHRV